MGHFSNDTLLVTGTTLRDVQRAHDMAVEQFKSLVSPIISGQANARYTFMVAPHGSKDGWPAQEADAEAREAYLRALESVAGDPVDFLHVDWVRLWFGGDNERAVILQDSLE